MPSITTGYSGSEVIELLKAYIGNQSDNFETYLSYELPLAEFKFCTMHDWSFLYVTGLGFDVTSGADVYALDPTTIGYYAAASDVIDVRDEDNNVILKKTTVDQIRRMDPNHDDGNVNNDVIRYWAPVGDNRIMVYPRYFKTTNLQVDAKMTPATPPFAGIQGMQAIAVTPNYNLTVAFVTNGTPAIPLSASVFQDAITFTLQTDGTGTVITTIQDVVQYVAQNTAINSLITIQAAGSFYLDLVTPTIPIALTKTFAIPYRYQSSFIEWLKGQALDRENDSRAPAQMAKALQMIRQDIADDQSNLGDTTTPRIKAVWEQYMDGTMATADAAYLYWAFYGSDY